MSFASLVGKALGAVPALIRLVRSSLPSQAKHVPVPPPLTAADIRRPSRAVPAVDGPTAVIDSGDGVRREIDKR